MQVKLMKKIDDDKEMLNDQEKILSKRTYLSRFQCWCDGHVWCSSKIIKHSNDLSHRLCQRFSSPLNRDLLVALQLAFNELMKRRPIFCISAWMAYWISGEKVDIKTVITQWVEVDNFFLLRCCDDGGSWGGLEMSKTVEIK